MKGMRIDVWSDFVCPFCYIGKTILDDALRELPEQEKVEVHYRSYQLDPDATYDPEKSFTETFSELKQIPVEQVKQMNAQIAARAKEVGLNYNFADMKYSNTFDSHRLLQYAKTEGKEEELTERLFYAYFTESRLLSDHETLLQLAEEVGLDRDKVKQVLSSDQYKEEVLSDIGLAYQIGVRGVPYFVFNNKYAVSGAQPKEVFVEVLQKVLAEEEN